ncbi:MAG: protein kinase [Thermoanaerobaculia bacterium]
MIGTVVGNYRVERDLSEGGMSHVYIGRTLSATPLLPEGHLVVLKVMSAELAGEVTARKRFVKEARILAQLRHRYITRFYEFIERDTGAVLVMEFADGHPVDKLISQRGALSVGDALSITQCLLEALTYAHGRGIIHRDIKPANLIKSKEGGLKVTDFGIAKIKEDAGATAVAATVLTRAGFLLGTPHYMSPEQIRDPKEAGASCDIYSTSVVLYEMLTGSLPFTQRSLPKLIEAIYKGGKAPPSALRPALDSSLDAIVLEGMAPDPKKRYQTAQDLCDALESYKQRIFAASPSPVAADDATVRTSGGAPDLQWLLEGVSGKHAVSGESALIGRDRTCAIVVPHPAVSRRHARITVTPASFLIEDLKSANGTYVNNARVESAKLQPGDIVRFGADPACSYTIRSRRRDEGTDPWPPQN